MPCIPRDISIASEGEPGLLPPCCGIEVGSSEPMPGEKPPSRVDALLALSMTDMRLTAESRLSQLVSSVTMSVIPAPIWNPLTVDMDENLECEAEFADEVYDDRLLWLSENLCLRDSGLAVSTGESPCIAIVCTFGCVDLMSSVKPNEYPPASHGVLLRLEALDSHVRLGGVFSGDGVGTIDEHAVDPSITDCVGVGPEEPSCSARLAAPDVFNMAVTSIMGLEDGASFAGVVRCVATSASESGQCQTEMY